jgi:hypothetical protein
MKFILKLSVAVAFGGAALCCAALRAQQPPTPASQNPAAQNSQTQNPQAQNPGGADVQAQNPTAPLGPVPLSEEPHHRLVLQNDFVHVYNVMVPPLDATLLHRHELPYLYLTLGQTELVNAIQGQPETRMTIQDGETHYTLGNFAHLVRTDSGLAFHNVTVELVHPQGTTRNLCKEVLRGEPMQCSSSAEVASTEKTAPVGEKSRSPRLPAKRGAGRMDKSAPADRDDRLSSGDSVQDDEMPLFETDELRVEQRKVAEGKDYVEASPKVHALLVALTDANLDANLGGEHVDFLHGGEVLWLPAGVPRRIVDFLGTHSSFLLISFKDGAPRPASGQ